VAAKSRIRGPTANISRGEGWRQGPQAAFFPSFFATTKSRERTLVRAAVAQYTRDEDRSKPSGRKSRIFFRGRILRP
jgi:hypothetical protein